MCPSTPGCRDARIEFLLDDAAPVAVLTAADLRPRLDGYGLVVIDVEDPAVGAQPATAPPGPAAEDHRLRYLHLRDDRNPQRGGGHPPQRHPTVRLARRSAWSLAPGQVWSQCHSLAFDFSVWEIFGALLHGGRLVVVPDAMTRSPERLPCVLVAEQVSVLTQTPSAVAVLSPRGLGVGGVGDRRGAVSDRSWWSGGRRVG